MLSEFVRSEYILRRSIKLQIKKLIGKYSYINRMTTAELFDFIERLEKKHIDKYEDML